MINERMTSLGRFRSAIRDIFEYSKKRAAEIGEENVFDFSIGNPSVPSPKEVNETIRELLDSQSDLYLHGYTSAQGDANTRQAIADNLNERFGTELSADEFYITCGAAAALTITLSALTVPGDEFLCVTPFFPEYKVFVETAGATFVPVASNPVTFRLDFAALEEAITARTKGIIINSPNNPSGVVLPEEEIRELAALLERKAAAFGHPIYLVSDEPYRELVYDDAPAVPFIPTIYRDTIVCYSFSKALSMPGERIGYALVPAQVQNADEIYAAVCGAGRALGYVCAPSLMQHVIERCAGAVADISVYKKNRDLLYNALTEAGFRCVHPDGAFYLFMKSPEEDSLAFCQKAREHELLFVPADTFGTPGYVRIAYCVSTEMIERSLPAFRALAEEYRKG